MGWLASFAVAVLSGGVALVVAGFVANACVTWYRVSGFEGKAGYAVVAVALLGGIAGFVIGLVTARVVAASEKPGFLLALGSALGVVVGLAALVLLVARLFADVPPRLGGQEMMLRLELRLPVGAELPQGTGPAPSVLLGSVVGGERRAVEAGKVELQQARQEDGHWLVPASVFLFTARGWRLLQVSLDGGQGEAFRLPLPTHPTAEHEQWSDWLPRTDAQGNPWPADKLGYRFRVERLGPGR